MKTILCALTTVVMLLASQVPVAQQPTPQQLPPEAYPGQRDHAKPPEGFFCTIPQLAKDKAHACSCKRMAQATPTDKCCEEVKPEDITEDAKCTVYCHKDHCTCPVKCVGGEDHAGHHQ